MRTYPTVFGIGIHYHQKIHVMRTTSQKSLPVCSNVIEGDMQMDRPTRT